MKIVFTGDINFRGIDPISAEASRAALAEVLPYLADADYVITNLETPLADKSKYAPIKKSGPNLISSPSNIVFLETMGADAVTLANNHIGDFGEGAIKDTLDLLDQHGIAHTGAGASSSDAYRAIYLRQSDNCVAVISVCENEFGMATKNTYGSAGYEPLLLLRQIREEKATADFVIVVFHGGNEFNPLPSPDTVNRYRLICDMGADAVIGGHTHCPQGYEYYDGKPIVYSMGNFLFKSSSERSANDSWYYGYMAELDVNKDGIDFNIIPYRFNPEATKITVFEGQDKQTMLGYIKNLSEIVKDTTLLDKYFGGWAYLHKWIPQAPSDYFNLEAYNSAGHYNLISCESHLSQAKKVLEFCFLDQVEAAKEWAERIKELAVMPPAVENAKKHTDLQDEITQRISIAR